MSKQEKFENTIREFSACFGLPLADCVNIITKLVGHARGPENTRDELKKAMQTLIDKENGIKNGGEK